MRDPNKICPCGRGLKRKKCLPEELLTTEDGSIVHAPPPVPREPMTDAARRVARQKLENLMALTSAIMTPSYRRGRF